jgi:threonylcarbamoyladenosine tRNA methylthiotransferase MtaB
MSGIRISIKTFGCRVNQYESEMMRDRLVPTYEMTDETPDIIILNACTVTALAERKARQAARRMRRDNPGAHVILIGCLADAVDQGTTLFPDADLLAGNSWKSRIDHVVQHALSGACGMMSTSVSDELSVEQSHGPSHRIRAFLKIQDGCSRACTYCRTTQVRGAPRSRSIESTRAEAEALVAAGFPEIVLTGIDLAQYSPDGGHLAEAVEAIASLDGLVRLRIASINPSGMTPQLIEACASIDTVCPHFHIPLQSGDSRILAAMRRGYDTTVYLETVDRIRSRIPCATFGTDIIVGFPGEDETAFARTCEVLDAVGYSNLHAFRYSPRRGTAAADFPHQVAPNTKRQRSETLIALWQDGLGSVLDNRIGSTQDVLVEEHRDNVWRGYTHDYLYVKFPSERKIPVGSLLPVRVIGRMGATLEGVDDHRTDAS